MQSAEKVPKAIEDHVWPTTPSEFYFTVSVGFSETVDVTTPDNRMAAADRKRYEAKPVGSDRVRV